MFFVVPFGHEAGHTKDIAWEMVLRGTPPAFAEHPPATEDHNHTATQMKLGSSHTFTAFIGGGPQMLKLCLLDAVDSQKKNERAFS